MSGHHILVLEDDPIQCRAMVRILTRDGYEPLVAHTLAQAVELVTMYDPGVAIVDLHLPDAVGPEILSTLSDLRPLMEQIVLTGSTDQRTEEQARLAGASDYFEKTTMDVRRLLQVMRRAMQVQHLRRTLHLMEPEAIPNRILGSSPAIKQVRALVERMAPASAPVLVTGESGVGKEVVAEALHERSGRTGTFVRINCAALPEALVEAELFGAEEGTFTGQRGRKQGLFAVADGGTLFLDEIGEMPLALQPKLLRALESRRFRPLGSSTEHELTARIVAATNVNLAEAAGRGTFREDLFYRLAVLTIRVPPLRDRLADVPILAGHFAKKYGASEGRVGVTLSHDALASLSEHTWPGNVRELANTIMRGVVLSRGPEIRPEDLDFGAAAAVAAVGLTASSFDEYLDMPLTQAKASLVEDFLRVYIARRLEEADGNITRAASASGMQRPNFKREMKRLGIDS